MAERSRATPRRIGVMVSLIRPFTPRKRTLEGAGNCVRLDHVSPIKTLEMALWSVSTHSTHSNLANGLEILGSADCRRPLPWSRLHARQVRSDRQKRTCRRGPTAGMIDEKC